MEEAYRRMAGAVMGLATRILNDRGLAEEVVQDTFVELVEKCEQIRDAKSVVGWVRRVAVNHCLMRLRSPWHARRDAEEAAPPMTDPGSAPERYEGLEALEHAFARLSVDARAVVWLHDVEGYTHKEIGEMLGKTASFSKSQLARAYERLVDWEDDATSGQSQPIEVTNGARKTHKTRDRHERSSLDNFGSPCTP